MTEDKYRYTSATETAAALRRGEVSSIALTEAAIARIEQLDPVLNAVVVRDFETARAAAKAADAAIAEGKTGPLLGVPMTVKESYDIAGHPTHWGIEPLKDYRAPADSEVVRRLRAAGAVILGKTNVPVSLSDWQSVNPIYGRTVNAYDPMRSAGGSSGGSAVALAAGYTPLEMGSDIGGSVRIPAAFNGVYGHKPSHGIVPLRGHAPGGMEGHEQPLAVGGPLARTAEDLKLAMDIVAGADGDDAAAWKLDLAPARFSTLDGVRVLLIDHHPLCATSRAVKGAMAELARELKEKGAKVSFESDKLPDFGAQHDAYLPTLMTIVTRSAPPSDATPSAHRWMELLDAQASYRRQWAALFKDFDVVVTPSFGRSAFPHDDNPDWANRTLTIDNEPTPYGAQLGWPAVALLPHLPATAFPIGFDADGLPLSAQAIGAFGADYTTIAFAGLAGRAFVPPKL